MRISSLYIWKTANRTKKYIQFILIAQRDGKIHAKY